MKTKKVLIVDDDTELLIIVKESIGCYPYPGWKMKIYTASNGLQAQKLTSKIAFHLIITDLQMPYKTGGAFISELRASQSPSARTSLIILSGFRTTDSRSKGPHSSTNDPTIRYLEKPIGYGTLISQVKEALAESENSEEVA